MLLLCYHVFTNKNRTFNNEKQTSVNNLGTFPYNKGVLTNKLEGTAHKIERMTYASFLFGWMNGFVARDKNVKDILAFS